MEELENKPVHSQVYVDVKSMFSTLWHRRKVFYWVLPIAFVLSAALILCVPRYYTCEVVLAPESQAATPSGSLQALVSSFGVDMRGMTSTDAIYPTIYPDVVKSPNFLVTLFDIQVSTADGKYTGTYYDYLYKVYRKPLLKRWKSKIISWLPKPADPQIMASDGDGGVKVFYLNKSQWGVIDMLRENVVCKVDRRTDMITFSVTSQDKLVSATIADSVCAAMQRVITNYRTKKTRDDIAYYESVMRKSYQEYLDASERYINFVDSHNGIQQEKYKIVAQNLESEMEIKQTVYTSFQKQYLAAEARLQEDTPVFTVIQSASILPKPTGPHRTSFVLVMVFLAFCVTSVVLCKDQLLGIIR